MLYDIHPIISFTFNLHTFDLSKKTKYASSITVFNSICKYGLFLNITSIVLVKACFSN